jgi:hypothetical protein
VEDQDYSSIRYTNPLQLAFDYTYVRRYWLILTIGGVASHALLVECWDYEDWSEDERGDDENVIVVSWHRTQRLIVHGQTVAYGTATNFNTGNDGLTPAARPPDVVGWTKEGDWGYDIEAITTGMLEVYNRLDAFSSEEDKLIINSYFPLASEEEAPIVKVTDNAPDYEHTRTELGEDWVHVGTESGYPTEAKFRISGTAGNQVEAFDAVITWPTSDPDDDPNAVHSHTEAFFGSGTYSGSTGYIDVGTYPTKGKPSNSDLDCYSSNITIKGEE